MSRKKSEIIFALKDKKENRIIRPSERGEDGRAPGKLYSVWKKGYFPFDTQDKEEMAEYIAEEYGPGYYQVMHARGNCDMYYYFKAWVFEDGSYEEPKK